MPPSESRAESRENPVDGVPHDDAPASTPGRYTLLDAGRAINQGRAVEAIQLLEALGELHSAAEAVRLRYLATANSLAGDVPRAFSLIERAEQIAGPESDAEEQVRAGALRAGLYLRTGADEEAAELLRGCVAACDAGRIADDQLHFRCLADLARVLSRRGETQAALDAFERAIALSERLGDARSRGDRYAELARSRMERGDVNVAVYYMQKSVFVFEELVLLDRIAATLKDAAVLYTEAGDTERARTCLRRAGALVAGSEPS